MVPADAAAWCTECGAPATPKTTSIDPTHPLGSCRRGCGKVAGVSRVLVTFDPAEGIGAMRRYHRRMVSRQHFRHQRGETISPYCDHCNRLGWSYPPAEPGTPAAGTTPAAVQPEGGSS